jgi:putative DNA primase/helicase
MKFETSHEGIPQELKALRQWVAWWSVAGQGIPVALPNSRPTRPLEPRPKPHKLPINAATGGLAMANNPGTWTTYEQACRAVERFDVTGVGFVFAPEGPYTGIDLDDCRHPETGEIAPWARRILDEFASYTEVSPSGRGVKLIVRATLPGGKGRRKKLESGEIEMYSRDRYFTITGQRVPGMPETIEDRSAALQALYDRMFGNTGQGVDRPQKAISCPTRFDRLWAGDTSDYGGDESRADLALCRVLARQTGNDPARIDALFRQSGLYRDKWERPDYRDRTIALALAPPDPAPASLKLTDLGNAERLVKQHGGDLRYCPELRTWLAWDGVRWNLDATACAVEYAKLTVRGIYREAAQAANPGLRQAVTDWARRSEAAGRLFAMVKLAESDQRLRVSPAELDRDTYLLNCSNGVVDLRTGELHPHVMERR